MGWRYNLEDGVDGRGCVAPERVGLHGAHLPVTEQVVDDDEAELLAHGTVLYYMYYTVLYCTVQHLAHGLQLERCQQQAGPAVRGKAARGAAAAAGVAGGLAAAQRVVQLLVRRRVPGLQRGRLLPAQLQRGVPGLDPPHEELLALFAKYIQQ